MLLNTRRLFLASKLSWSDDRTTEEILFSAHDNVHSNLLPPSKLRTLSHVEILLNEIDGNISTYEDYLDYTYQMMNNYCPMDLFMSYRDQHKLIDKTNFNEQRISLFYSAGRGLGDKVVSAVTTFYTALLSNRAFKTVFRTRAANRARSTDHSFSFIDVYNSPWIDLPLNGNNTVTDKDKESRKIVSFFPFRQAEKHYSYDYYLTTNFTAEHSNERLVHWMLTKGSLHSLLENPYHRDWFKNHNLHSNNAFSCAMQFLFQPNRDTFEFGGMSKLWTLFRNSNVLKIGIQIRVGDHTFEENNAHTDIWIENIVSPFVSCAQQIEAFQDVDQEVAKNNRTKMKQTIWFISSDSELVLNHLNSKYAHKTINLPSPTIEHTADSSKAGIQSAVQDHVLLGMQDYAIVYDLTSFGRSGALRQLQYGGKHMYHIKRGSGTAKDPLSTNNYTPKCGPLDYAQWDQYSKEWIGI